MSRRKTANSVRLISIVDGVENKVTGLPEFAAIDHVRFSPDGSRVAFTNTTESGLELWVIDVQTAKAERIHSTLNGVLSVRERPFAWISDRAALIAKTVPSSRGAPPTMSGVPNGPTIQQTTGEVSPARTYQDLLKNRHDEAVFGYYAKSQLVVVNVDGNIKKVGAPAIYAKISPSPDGELLLVEKLERPFSYLVPYSRFAGRVEVWDISGNFVAEVARMNLAEDVPIGRNAVRTGRRNVRWRSDADSTVYWVEARDGGDPKANVKYRDEVYTWSRPFDEEPQLLISMGYRFRDVYWGDDNVALFREWWWENRGERIWKVQPGSRDTPPVKVFDYSYEDRYNAPGTPLMKRTSRDTSLLITSKDGLIYLTSEGASPEGNRPFVNAFDFKTGSTKTVFRSSRPYLETPIMWMDLEENKLLTRRESKDEPPNFYVRDVLSGNVRALTNFSHPYPALAGVGRELIRYSRADGVKLTATLYTPPDYEEGDPPLPMLVWAYPREYKSLAAAAQVRDSPDRFSQVAWGSPLYWLTEGYAVMEGATMPIVGEGEQEPNDTYVEQLVASAQAAVDEAVQRGIADSNRVAIAGHSYGAFMTANLLAHSDIFRAGIARSGAFNRTLTPFGFQSEQRTFWEAPEIYFSMSPFMHAQKINEPILLTHGEVDNNSGTFPIQSRRLYHALQGHGATARLVMFPYESHGFSARESVMHLLWEMNRWLDKYVKNAPRGKDATETH